ncbi:MAG: hypothetical protein HXY22_13210 [Alphaproteobacteria bacterium]|nr:hypothetical protein [Alphaproteobacteria bacterium]
MSAGWFFFGSLVWAALLYVGLYPDDPLKLLLLPDEGPVWAGLLAKITPGWLVAATGLFLIHVLFPAVLTKLVAWRVSFSFILSVWAALIAGPLFFVYLVITVLQNLSNYWDLHLAMMPAGAALTVFFLFWFGFVVWSQLRAALQLSLAASAFTLLTVTAANIATLEVGWRQFAGVYFVPRDLSLVGVPPGLNSGEVILADYALYRWFCLPKSGDLILEGETPADYDIMRIIAVEGDRLELSKDGAFSINGVPVQSIPEGNLSLWLPGEDERLTVPAFRQRLPNGASYAVIGLSALPGLEPGVIEVPQGKVLLAPDDRRVEGGVPVKEAVIVGTKQIAARVRYRLWPLWTPLESWPEGDPP